MAQGSTPITKSSKDPYIGKVVAGRYRIESMLGEGGMGVVYRARHVLIDRVVALKLIRPDLKGETHLRAWMLREARAANRVDHAHIVDIHDVGETEENELYLVMEYLVGISLATEIGKGQFPLARAVDVLEQMCAALARAHDLGVVHRDLKADNIMITSRGGRKDFVKILDFGLAALARDPRLAPKGAVFGTPEYMSPEQARGEDAMPASDLYALGILFYEMLTGQLPFRSNNRDTLLEMQKTKPASSPKLIREDIPDAAETIIMTLLEKDPKKRFRDGHHLQEELKALQRRLPSTLEVPSSEAAVPVVAPPPPPPSSPSVVDWSKRAAYFSRMVYRVHPNGKIPEEVASAVARLWEVSARASQLEGELAIHQKKLDTVEKRGRALRAEIGRKVEELAEEESRALREAGGEKERCVQIRVRMEEGNKQHGLIQGKVQALVEKNTDVNSMKLLYEELGAAKAKVEVWGDVYRDLDKRARNKETVASELRKQIDDLRAQLLKYSEALESDLAQGRERMASKVKEALSYEKTFEDCSSLLFSYLQPKPEVAELLDEMKIQSTRPQQQRIELESRRI